MVYRPRFREDRRFIAFMSLAAAVLLMDAMGHPPADGVLTFLGLGLTAFMAQSQWGAVTKDKLEAQRAPPPAAG